MKVQCPTCGAEQQIVNPAAISFQCPYCDAISMLVDQDWKPTGKKSRLSQGFSRLYCGALCTIHGNEYRVIGRVRYSYGKGFWDEWYALTDTGEGSWITEDDHEFSVQVEVPFDRVSTDIQNLTIGDELVVGDHTYRILEWGEAVCLGLEGELPKGVLPDESYRYADGGSLDGTHAIGIEYDGTPPAVYVGRWIEAKDIRVAD